MIKVFLTYHEVVIFVTVKI